MSCSKIEEKEDKSIIATASSYKLKFEWRKKEGISAKKRRLDSKERPKSKNPRKRLLDIRAENDEDK